jgi:molybdenum cofactor cytidylyltransferase
MLPATHKSLAGILLAAGGSTRLGQPKQLYEWRSKPLVCHAVENCLAVCGAGVIVVTGSHAQDVEAALQTYAVQIVRNRQWATGMSGSLRAGIQQLGVGVSGILVSLCDQPLLDAGDLAGLAKLWQVKPALPAAALYNGVTGVPAIFPASLLDSLLELRGDAGARALLDACPSVSTVEMPSAAFDVDTVDDLARLRAHEVDCD